MYLCMILTHSHLMKFSTLMVLHNVYISTISILSKLISYFMLFYINVICSYGYTLLITIHVVLMHP